MFVFLLSSLFSVACGRSIKNHQTKIVDIVHNNVPKIHNKYISDILVFLQVVYTLSILTKIEFSDFFMMMAITQFLKSFCFVSTILPPLKDYNDKLRFWGINGNGTEYIFSGHASYCALSTMYLLKYNYNVYILSIYNIITQFLITATRNHYTVDIVLAWIIVPLIYTNKYITFLLSSENNFSIIST